jgi:Cd2+/Zn2+-exporting ATPase
MAIATAARKGVIIKGGVYIEKMDKVKTVVFDKTGTLTLGQASVCEINCSNQSNDQKALRYAAALEQYSNHPLAQGFVKRAAEQGHKVRDLEVKNLKEVPGKGIVGYVDDCRVSIGNAEFMRDEGIDLDNASTPIEDEKHTRVFVSIDRCTPPSFCLTDQVRDDATLAVKALRDAGTHTVMLTGDRAEIAEEVAKRLGVDETHAGLFPEDKLEIMDKLKVKKGLVAMVGDGINDAPSLAASDVGIAMSSSGVDVALESADIVLVENELARIPYLQRLSRLSTKIAKQNITISLGVKILLGALGFLGLVPLWFAVAAGDDGVTMLLLLNTLRIPRLRA